MLCSALYSLPLLPNQTHADGGGSVYEYDEEIEVSPEDEAALAAFMAPDADSYRQRTLADLVLERIREKQAEQGVSEIPRCVRLSNCVFGGVGGREQGSVCIAGSGGGVSMGAHRARNAVLVYGRGSSPCGGHCLPAEVADLQQRAAGRAHWAVPAVTLPAAAHAPHIHPLKFQSWIGCPAGILPLCSFLPHLLPSQLTDFCLSACVPACARHGVCREGQEFVPDELDPKVVEVYQGVGKVLSRYTAGKVSPARQLGLASLPALPGLPACAGLPPHAPLAPCTALG